MSLPVLSLYSLAASSAALETLSLSASLHLRPILSSWSMYIDSRIRPFRVSSYLSSLLFPAISNPHAVYVNPENAPPPPAPQPTSTDGPPDRLVTCFHCEIPAATPPCRHFRRPALFNNKRVTLYVKILISLLSPPPTLATLFVQIGSIQSHRAVGHVVPIQLHASGVAF